MAKVLDAYAAEFASTREGHFTPLARLMSAVQIRTEAEEENWPSKLPHSSLIYLVVDSKVASRISDEQ